MPGLYKLRQLPGREADHTLGAVWCLLAGGDQWYCAPLVFPGVYLSLSLLLLPLIVIFDFVSLTFLDSKDEFGGFISESPSRPGDGR